MKVIAEVGSNFNTEKDLLDSIKIASDCGADIVKFQYFSQEDLYGFGSSIHNFSPEMFPFLRDKALEHGIGFMCSAFSTKGYEFVNDYVDIHKIASAEISALDILKTVNDFEKPTIISNGGSSNYETLLAVQKLFKCDLTVMFCVGDYPAKILSFDKFKVFRDYFLPLCSVGFSDHSSDVLNIPKMAKDFGIKYLEKHVDFFNSKDSLDYGHSLNKSEFKLMVDNLNGLSYQLPQHSVRDHKRYYNEVLEKWVRPLVKD